MKEPYEECSSCIAKKWCKRYSGESPRPSSPEWCNPKFRMDKAISLSGLPLEYLEANISNYVVDDDNKGVYDIIKPFVDNAVVEIDKGTNFFFFNKGTGTGKTFNGAVIFNQFLYKTCLTERFDFEHPLGIFAVYADLMDDLRYRRDDEDVQENLKTIRSVPLLLLDDIGSGTTSDFTIEQTYLLLNHRFNKRLSTILTSNFGLDELAHAKIIGQRNVSRISKGCLVVNMPGRDRRTAQMRGVHR